MSLTYDIKNYATFGKCVCIENDLMELYVTIDLGPRIIKFNLKGKQNMMFNDDERKIYHDEPNLKEMFGKDARWDIYGGHRFWISPENIPRHIIPTILRLTIRSKEMFSHFMLQSKFSPAGRKL